MDNINKINISNLIIITWLENGLLVFSLTDDKLCRAAVSK